MQKMPVAYKYKVITVLFVFYFFIPQSVEAQFLMDMVDTTKDMGKGVLSIYKRFDHIRIGGYIQPQYQVASAEGAAGYSGGDFAKNSR